MRGIPPINKSDQLPSFGSRQDLLQHLSSLPRGTAILRLGVHRLVYFLPSGRGFSGGASSLFGVREKLVPDLCHICANFR